MPMRLQTRSSMQYGGLVCNSIRLFGQRPACALIPTLVRKLGRCQKAIPPCRPLAARRLRRSDLIKPTTRGSETHSRRPIHEPRPPLPKPLELSHDLREIGRHGMALSSALSCTASRAQVRTTRIPAANRQRNPGSLYRRWGWHMQHQVCIGIWCMRHCSIGRLQLPYIPSFSFGSAPRAFAHPPIAHCLPPVAKPVLESCQRETLSPWRLGVFTSPKNGTD
ncbi:hypothetical protein B0T14DRAFT_327126 [Immersiella caudata]|uniref:Uncharacterized protein n=1 Tax=Immersiella caudata TaxID=314043 RepID=A0AA39TXX3_9PEZI|nr:hypothetical protein B0T14DRAFT_327126 [Immersiella caudata]